MPSWEFKAILSPRFYLVVQQKLDHAQIVLCPREKLCVNCEGRDNVKVNSEMSQHYEAHCTNAQLDVLLEL